VGIALLPADQFQLDLGVRIALAFPIGPFDTTQAWLSPFVAGSWRF